VIAIFGDQEKKSRDTRREGTGEEGRDLGHLGQPFVSPATGTKKKESGNQGGEKIAPKLKKNKKRVGRKEREGEMERRTLDNLTGMGVLGGGGGKEKKSYQDPTRG